MQVAAVALAVEAALMDHDFADVERKTISAHVQSVFGLTETEADEMIDEAEQLVNESGQLYRFTRVINDHMEPEQRIDLVEIMWDVAYADGHLDAYEAALMRRITGLIHVSDRDSAHARQKVLARRNLKSD